MIRHVVLVGHMGSGKSTVGRKLAARLGRDFIDADQALVEIVDRTIADIFERDGEEGFRSIEADVLEELLEHHTPAVIATGGGVVLRTENRLRLQHDSITVVWLTATPAFLASRVEGRTHRPLLNGGQSALEVLTRLDTERAQLYAEVADLSVDVQPFDDAVEKPKHALIERVADAVVAHEAALSEGAPS